MGRLATSPAANSHGRLVRPCRSTMTPSSTTTRPLPPAGSLAGRRSRPRRWPPGSSARRAARPPPLRRRPCNAVTRCSAAGGRPAGGAAPRRPIPAGTDRPRQRLVQGFHHGHLAAKLACDRGHLQPDEAGTDDQQGSLPAQTPPEPAGVVGGTEVAAASRSLPETLSRRGLAPVASSTLSAASVSRRRGRAGPCRRTGRWRVPDGPTAARSGWSGAGRRERSG